VRVLIRFLTRASGGAIESRERIVDGDVVTLGRATDRTLHLKDMRVALEHARIFRSGGRMLIACKSPAQVIVNGSVRRDAELSVGDTVQLGSNTLRLIEPPPGFDLAFTFELDSAADTRAAEIERPQLALTQLGLHKRRWAWTLFLACVSLGLLVPIGGAMREGGSESLRAMHLPSDRIWQAGALHLAHGTLNGRCEACHQKPFVQVRSEACLECHSTNLRRHVETASVDADRLACTSCHVEHDEPARLVQTDQRLCATCHDGTKEIARATDFLQDHPEFHDTKMLGRGQGLMFPHDVHLDAKGVKTPRGTQTMQCADCHQPEAGGARMQPIRMEQHCASCHTLDFDPADPDRAVPHGDPRQVLASLNEYYGARYLAGYPDSLASAKPDRVVRLPAIELPRAERTRLLGLARTRSELVARDLFERRTCVECHDVKRDDGANGPDWKVAKVVLASSWMPNARFDHSKHGTSLTPCKTCHEATTSKEADEVLMPTLATCRQCHGGEPRHAERTSLVASTCTMCHAFHIDRHEMWTRP
jgi:predicted CXXCH cytochrome family protein